MVRKLCVVKYLDEVDWADHLQLNHYADLISSAMIASTMDYDMACPEKYDVVEQESEI